MLESMSALFPVALPVSVGMVFAYSWNPIPVSAAMIPGKVLRGDRRTAKILMLFARSMEWIL